MQTPWWWRDPIVLAQLQVVVAVLGALLAVVAVLYAWRVAKRQFSMMEDQDDLMNRQLSVMSEETEISKRLEALADKQSAILTRQGEIAEFQYKTMKEQLSKVAMLRIVLVPEDPTAAALKYQVAIENFGTKSTESAYYHLYIPVGHEAQISANLPRDAVAERGRIFDEVYHHYSGIVKGPLYKERHVTFGEISVNLRVAVSPLVVRWRVICDDGEFPAVDDWGALNVLNVNSHPGEESLRMRFRRPQS